MALSDTAWPAVVVTGTVVVSAGTVFGLLGCVADAVRNGRLYRALFIRTAVPLVLLGAALVILGVGGWWVVLAVAVLAAFGWLIKPRRPVEH